MKGYYIINELSSIIAVPWVLYAYAENRKFSYTFEENFLENQVIQIKRFKLDNKLNEINIPDFN